MRIADALLELMRNGGFATREELAAHVRMGPELVGRFLRLHDLAEDIRAHLTSLGTMKGRSRITESDLRAIARTPDARRQRVAFARLLRMKNLSG